MDKINYSNLPNIEYIGHDKVITTSDIIKGWSDFVIYLIFISSLILFLYIIWVNFFMKSSVQKKLEANKIDVHELAIMPGVALFLISIILLGRL